MIVFSRYHISGGTTICFHITHYLRIQGHITCISVFWSYFFSDWALLKHRRIGGLYFCSGTWLAMCFFILAWSFRYISWCADSLMGWGMEQSITSSLTFLFVLGSGLGYPSLVTTSSSQTRGQLNNEELFHPTKIHWMTPLLDAWSDSSDQTPHKFIR